VVDRRRRHFLQSGSLGLLACSLGGVELLLTPREARARTVPMRVLSPAEVANLEVLGEILLPGAREAGIAHFIDHQLAVDAADCLLLIRYLDVPPPYLDIYRPALAALDAASQAAYQKAFTALDEKTAISLVRTMSERNPEGWQGPPAPLFYFAVRSDAVDVVYGTEEGFDRLGIPYMAHIRPTAKW
jgi:hypothetical protein